MAKRTGLYVGIAIVFIIVLVAGGFLLYWFLIRKKKNNTNSNGTNGSTNNPANLAGGTLCSTNSQCASGICSVGKCTYIAHSVATGATCNGTVDCVVNSTCSTDTKKCISNGSVAVNKLCDNNNQCASLKCSPTLFKCLNPDRSLNNGDICSTDSECALDSTCYNGRCTSVIIDGTRRYTLTNLGNNNALQRNWGSNDAVTDNGPNISAHPDQNMLIVPVSDYIYIKNDNGGDGNQVIDGASAAYFGAYNGGDYQLFKMIPTPDSKVFFLQQKATGNVLDAGDGVGFNGNNGGGYQKWRFDAI